MFPLSISTNSNKKIAKDKCAHCAMALDYTFIHLSMAIDGPIAKNHRSVGTSLYVDIFMIMIQTFNLCGSAGSDVKNSKFTAGIAYLKRVIATG